MVFVRDDGLPPANTPVHVRRAYFYYTGRDMLLDMCEGELNALRFLPPDACWFDIEGHGSLLDDLRERYQRFGIGRFLDETGFFDFSVDNAATAAIDAALAKGVSNAYKLKLVGAADAEADGGANGDFGQ